MITIYVRNDTRIACMGKGMHISQRLAEVWVASRSETALPNIMLFFMFGIQLPCCMQVDEYQGPLFKAITYTG